VAEIIPAQHKRHKLIHQTYFCSEASSPAMFYQWKEPTPVDRRALPFISVYGKTMPRRAGFATWIPMNF
jgi:hypothetical protein